MSKQLTNTELAILSLIVERDMHGYEIETVIEERGMRNWTEVGFSSIYFVLKVLEKSGLVDSRLEKAPGKGPARRVYSSTIDGRRSYQQGVVRALSTAERPYPLFLQGLAGLPLMENREATDCLGRYVEGLEARLAEVSGRDGTGVPFHVAEMFAHARCLILAEREYVRGLIERIGGRSSAPGKNVTEA